MLEVLGTSVESGVPLMAAGIDSLGASELQRALNLSLSIDLPATLLFDHPSIDEIASSIIQGTPCPQDTGSSIDQQKAD